MSLVPSASRRRLLEGASRKYAEAITEAAPYLAGRGFTKQIATEYRLGFVADPYSGHEPYVGRISIPYLSRAGVTTIRFRALGDAQPKYMSLPKDAARIFNTKAFFTPSPVIAVTEGEFDAITVHEFAGIPAVGLPGASSWRPVFAKCFAGYEEVLVIGDGDEAGEKFASKIIDTVECARQVRLPAGEDCNSLLVKEGPQIFYDLFDSRE